MVLTLAVLHGLIGGRRKSGTTRDAFPQKGAGESFDLEQLEVNQRRHGHEREERAQLQAAVSLAVEACARLSGDRATAVCTYSHGCSLVVQMQH